MSQRIVFFGTPEMARTSLIALVEAGVEVVAAVTQPDRPVGRGRKLTPPPVKLEAEARGIPVYQPPSIKAETCREWLKDLDADWLVVIAYGQILPPGVLNACREKAVNLHFSLLPAWRGAAPVNWAVANGDAETGVTTMFMDEGLDTGPILLQRKTAIEPTETAGELAARLSLMGGELLVETLDRLAKGEITPTPQDHSRASYARQLKPEDGKLDLTRPAERVSAWARGMTPWPGPFVHYRDKRLKLFGFAHNDSPPKGEPGRVIDVGPQGFKIACGRGHLFVARVQHPGKKIIEAKAAAMGGGPRPGDVLT